LQNGTRIFRKSGDDPRSMQGERVTYAVMEEAQDVPDEAWQNLMPGLADSNGRLAAIGITRGRGRFRSYWYRGQGADPAYYSASVPTSANPVMGELAEKEGYATVDEYIDTVLAGDLTDIERRQQYYAEWVDGDGQVFKDFERWFDAPRWNEPYLGSFIMGIDVAKLHDFLVAYVVDVKTQTFVDSFRVQGMDYTVAGQHVADLYHRWGCIFAHMDVMSSGEAFRDILRAHGCATLPFQYSHESKGRLIGRFASEVARGNVHFLADDDVLKKEMTMFEATVSSNLIRYDAPKGFFDDAVNAAALAVYKSAPNRRMGRSPVNKPYVTFTKEGAPRVPNFKRRRMVA
jgi:hypothetical protein